MILNVIKIHFSLNLCAKNNYMKHHNLADLNGKYIVLSLIKDDIINFKLVFSLNEIGLNAGNYFLHLSEVIFSLIGYSDEERTDELYEKYHELTKKSLYIDISVSTEPLDGLVNEIYIALIERRHIIPPD